MYRLEQHCLSYAVANRFVDLKGDLCLDAKTIYKYREVLADSGQVEWILDKLTEQIAACW